MEACDEQEQPFGEERLLQLTRELAENGASAHSIQGALLQAVSRHCGGKFQDDATLIVLQRERDTAARSPHVIRQSILV